MSGISNGIASLREAERGLMTGVHGALQSARGQEDGPGGRMTRRLAEQLARLRAEQGWTLDQLAKRSGVSRAALSRLEHAEVSPSADVLGRICAAHGMRPSQLMARIEDGFRAAVPGDAQREWRDPDRAVSTREVSPAAPGLSGEVTEWRFGPGIVTELPTPAAALTECHLVMQQGRLRLRLEEAAHVVSRGDTLRFQRSSGATVEVLGEAAVKFLLFTVAV